MIELLLYENLLQALEFAEMDGNFKALRDAIYALIALNPNNLPVSQSGGASKILATDASGNLGIGAAPHAWIGGISKAIELPQISLFSGSGLGGMLLGNAYINAAGSMRYQNDGPATSYNNQGGTHIWSVAAAGLNGNQILFSESARISPSGNLLVGVDNGSNHRILKNNSAGGVLSLENTANTSGDYCLTTSLGGNTNNTNSYHLACYTSGVVKSGIYGNGTSFGMSDVNYKTNTETARSYLNDLCKIRVVKYQWKGSSDTSLKELGVIAQELETVFPGMVGENAIRAERQKVVDGVLQFEQRIVQSEILSATGEPVVTYEDDPDKPIMETYLTGEITKSVKYSVFVPMLITAVQELKANNDALEARLAALEEKLAV